MRNEADYKNVQMGRVFGWNRQTFHLMAGLPRSGSTVLTAILNQNPYIYATPTSPLLDLLVKNQDAWHADPAVKANTFSDQLTNMTKGMIGGAWQHRCEDIIIDKHRGWAANMKAANILFGREMKIIVTLRDLPSIMASWLTLMRNNPGNVIDQHIERNNNGRLDDNLRVREMYFNVVRPCLQMVKQLPFDTKRDNVHYVRYNQLMLDPVKTLSDIEKFLKIVPHTYDFDNIVSDFVDDDLSAFGLQGLHTIRKHLLCTSSQPILVLGKTLYEEFEEIGREYGI
jgi:sulfotransferase